MKCFMLYSEIDGVYFSEEVFFVDDPSKIVEYLEKTYETKNLSYNDNLNFIHGYIVGHDGVIYYSLDIVEFRLIVLE